MSFYDDDWRWFFFLLLLYTVHCSGQLFWNFILPNPNGVQYLMDGKNDCWWVEVRNREENKHLKNIKNIPVIHDKIYILRLSTFIFYLDSSHLIPSKDISKSHNRWMNKSMWSVKKSRICSSLRLIISSQLKTRHRFYMSDRVKMGVREKLK